MDGFFNSLLGAGPGMSPYHLGLPAWAFPGWRGRYFEAQGSALGSYARVFNAVEGNTTFYRVPDAGSIQAWRKALAGRDFRICCKLPRAVTHEPRPDHAELRRFLSAIEPLGEYLGPLLLQFPARVGPAQLGDLEALFAALPGHLRAVVEVRHPDFFARPESLEPLLAQFGYGRVTLDTRALYRGDRRHPDVLNALHEKPDLPVLSGVCSGLAFVRLVLHPDESSNAPYIEAWAQQVAGYLAAGHEVFMMIHCPNNLHCPALAERFHERLRREPGGTGLPSLPPWPVPQQASLI